MLNPQPRFRILPRDIDPSPADRCVVELLTLNQDFPDDDLTAMITQLQEAIDRAGALYAERELPHRADLLAELTRWRSHLETCRQFGERCGELIARTMIWVSSGTPAPR